MSASLVGSEMCIRDRFPTTRAGGSCPKKQGVGSQLLPLAHPAARGDGAAVCRSAILSLIQI
eukprot:14224845-Alexandrium_andersonii.AAC.1